MQDALAYVYGGDWVADCPRECGNVEHLFVAINPTDLMAPRVIKRPDFFCSYCKTVSGIEWPELMNDILMILNKRPVPYTRNWYPTDHPTAKKFNLADGQSLDDLTEENRIHGVM